jgi:hypothetical protein
VCCYLHVSLLSLCYYVTGTMCTSLMYAVQYSYGVVLMPWHCITIMMDRTLDELFLCWPYVTSVLR